MALTLTLKLSGLTYGALYRFADQARAAGIANDEMVETTSTIEDDWSGLHHGPVVPGSFVLRLGEIDSLVRPVLIDGRDAAVYAEALHALRSQQGGENLEALDRLQRLLWNVPVDDPAATPDT